MQFKQLFHLPHSELRCDQYSLSDCEITQNLMRNLGVFDSDTMTIGRIAILKLGGESAVINTQSRY